MAPGGAPYAGRDEGPHSLGEPCEAGRNEQPGDRTVACCALRMSGAHDSWGRRLTDVML